MRTFPPPSKFINAGISEREHIVKVRARVRQQTDGIMTVWHPQF